MQFKPLDVADMTPGVDEISKILGAQGFSLLMDRMADGVLIIDSWGVVQSINIVAVQINNVKARDVLQKSFESFAMASSLDWVEYLLLPPSTRKRELIVSADDGRSILVSVRHLRGTSGDISFTLMFMRDLQVFDHLRRTAAGNNTSNIFKFMAERDIGPDFEAQRNLSKNVDTMIVRGSRALSQGARLLLIGESGSGKTEQAKYLHRLVGSPDDPFIHVNCGAIPESLFESEMFGYERGAFTGALQTGKRGLIEAAEGGTIFLDEIGEIPLPCQAKLLKFLEDGIVQKIGGQSGKKINTSVISATNRDLWSLVSEKKFRNDLYYRLAVITLEVTPLREQPELIHHLIDHFVTAANRTRKPQLRISDACRTLLATQLFPGNIRELHNLIQHLSVMADDEARPEHLPPYVLEVGGLSALVDKELEVIQQTSGLSSDNTGAQTKPLKDQVRNFERTLIDHAIDRLGSKRKAARALGVDIGTIVRKTQGERSEL